jgi:predicted DNA-binding transcriptional regulator AlpA
MHQFLHAAASSRDHLLDRAEVCRYFGGTRPINPATLYRGIKQGRYPKPIKVGPQSSRWLREECEAVLRAMEEARR